MNRVPQNVWVLTEAYQDGMYHSGEKYIKKKGRQYTSLPQSLGDVKPFRLLTFIHAHASSHAFVELADNCLHILWYAKACEHNPQQLSVDGAICFLEID